MTDEAEEPDAVRVLSIPPGQVHDLRSALDFGGGPHRSDLWPGFAPAALLPDPQWVEVHAHEFDVAHLHLGLGAMSSVSLFHLMVRLRACGKPVVLTVHNLEHPCLEQPVLDELLRVAVPTADEIVTFTVGAAREILRRWGRVAHIIPHPPVILGDRPAAARAPHRRFVVGIALTPRCGIAESWETVEDAARALRGMTSTALQVEIDPIFVTPGSPSYCPALVERARDLVARGALTLGVHEPLGVPELASYLRGLDAFVLPQRRGTHSSWVEACHDVGTTVVVPDRGFYAEQRRCRVYALGDADGLATALRVARHSRTSRTVSPGDLAAEQRFIARAHRELYLALTCGTPT